MKKSFALLVALCFMLVSLAAGCGKEEPVPVPTPKAATPAPTPQPEKKVITIGEDGDKKLIKKSGDKPGKPSKLTKKSGNKKK
ncbi:hypothetical protein K8I61_15685 [bacterium]|nr:hypothetical protein [bacterium]